MASLSLDELNGFNWDQKGFILACEAFIQLNRKSQELFQVKKKNVLAQILKLKMM